MPAENITLTAQWTANIDWDLDIEISFRNIGTSSATRTSEYDFGTNLTNATEADQYIGDTIGSIINSYLGNNHNKSLSYKFEYYNSSMGYSIVSSGNNRYGVYTNILIFKNDTMYPYDTAELVRVTIFYNDPV
jgi:hypothetical protein